MTIHYETEGNIATVTIDRQEVANAVDRETAARLVDAFERFEADESANVAILTGAGKSFCAGGDLKAILEGKGVVVELEGPGPLGPLTCRGVQVVLYDTCTEMSSTLERCVEEPPSPLASLRLQSQ